MGEEQDSSRKKTGWRGYLREGDLGKRIAIGVVLLLSFMMFVHFREVRVETLRLDATAKNYVFAQVDFEFPDEEGTVVFFHQALRDLSPIYKIGSKEVKQQRYNFEDMLIHDDAWRGKLPKTTFEEMYIGANSLQTFLLSARFTDARTLKKMQSLGIATSSYYVIDSVEESKLRFPSHFWSDAKDVVLNKGKLNRGAAEYITHYFQSRRWDFEQDTKVQKRINAALEKELPQKYTHVPAGTRIVDRGEKVDESHLAKLEAMNEAIAQRRNLWSPITLLSSFLFALVIVGSGALYFRYYDETLYYSAKNLALFTTVVILTLLLGKVIEHLLIANTNTFIDSIRYPLIVPFAAILLCVLLAPQLAIFTASVLAVVMGFTLAVDHNRVVVLNLFTGIIAVIAAQNLRKRKEVFGVCAKVWLCTLPIFLLFLFSQDLYWSHTLIDDGFSSLLFVLLTAILVVGLLPVLESIFGIMTDITLMEYMDPNNELLRRLSIEAPGSYQHSLVVGSIAEAAAQAINADGLFCRVATLYHDIGKLFNPHYFTENQMGGFNIHQLLTPLESTQVIIAHVTEGVSLARKYGLPQGFVDIIQEHHGTTLVYYFYCKQVEQMGGDVDAVDEKQFRYPGPRPKTKESAIIMIADTIEAASRSLEEANEETIEELVDRLVSDKAEEGQFDECRLTFEELGRVKKTISKTLAVTRHLRVKYPTKK